jgi:hypothetical protein
MNTVVIELLIWIHISEHKLSNAFRRLPRFVIKCVIVVCDSEPYMFKMDP